MHIEHGRRYDNKHGSLPHRPQLARTPGPKIQAGDPGAQWAWNTVLKVLLCLVLFCGTDLLKTLAAKSLARTFHKDAHFAKMQDALEKARRAGLQAPHAARPCWRCSVCRRQVSAAQAGCPAVSKQPCARPDHGHGGRRSA